jgi:cytosine/adenosine deaminase-related metal-dependent hydrolase
VRRQAGSVVAADWVLPVAAAPIRAGAVAIDNDRVGWLGPLAKLPAPWSQARIDRRPGIITPGLVNAHTHLQYTGFAALGQRRYSGFEQWSFAFEADYRAVTQPGYWAASAMAGVRQAVAAGTTVFADIITNDEARGALAACGVTGIEYLEAIGHLERNWYNGARADFLARLERPGQTPAGISPHAPYSLDGSVIKDLMAIAASHGARVHLHLGESALEQNLYRHGEASMLAIYGATRDEFELVRRGGAGQDTASYADSLGVLVPTTHLAHAIYLDRAGRDLLLRRGTQVALCPRSNAVLGLRPAPVAAYLSEGHQIAVGTDSLASSPSLDLMADVAELAVIAREQGYRGDDLAARLVRAATLGGATALGLAGRGYGTLQPGGPADLAVFDARAGDDAAEAALVSGGQGRCTLTVAAGAVIHDAAVHPGPASIRIRRG